MLGLILTILVVGLIAGAIARLVVPGKQHISILGTIVLGVVGSLVGGFLGYLLFHKDAGDGFLQPAGLIGSIIGAIIVLLVWVRAWLAPYGARLSTPMADRCAPVPPAAVRSWSSRWTPTHRRRRRARAVSRSAVPLRLHVARVSILSWARHRAPQRAGSTMVMPATVA